MNEETKETQSINTRNIEKEGQLRDKKIFKS